MELVEPLINEQTREINFTNEIDYGDSVWFLTNVIGLWLVQECRRRWAVKGDNLGYDELCRLAGLAEPFACFIDPDDKRFFHPDDMLAEIAGFCRETGQPEPADPKAYARMLLREPSLGVSSKGGRIARTDGTSCRSGARSWGRESERLAQSIHR
jgi:rhamnulokinase